MCRLLGVLFGAVAFGALAFGAGTSEVYVWQRRFDREVVAALHGFAPQLDGACVLATEVAWKEGKMEITRVPLDFPGLARFGKPLGLAVRIGDYAGSFARDDAAARELVRLSRDLLAKAAANGLAVAELQIDYDCAESKLAGFRAWLTALRGALAGTKTKLVFTALPAWLGHAEFRRLAHLADGFVLQVHSLARPASPDAAFTLCDPVRAEAWAQQAGAAGVPFRIALPTYSYVLGFDAAGKFLGVAAEGAAPSWPASARRRVVRADAPEISRLAARFLATPPPQCAGVIWFRMPVPRDRYNWDAVTFAAVLRGEVPASRLNAEAAWVEPGLVEISVANPGQTTEPLP